MRESFLHYLWKYKKFQTNKIKTSQGEALNVINVGEHNAHSGPDFFNAKLEIGGQLWAGNVEIHLKSTDWFIHNHEIDEAYNNVILHVVWEHDTDIFYADNTVVPALVLKDYVDPKVLANYQALSSSNKKWIFCENSFDQVEDFLLSNWLERLYIERLERKTQEIQNLLQASLNNWKAVLFQLLAKNFGLKINGDAFGSMAVRTSWNVIQKVTPNLQQLEALFFGQIGLLEDNFQESYYFELQKEYAYLQHKFNLNNQGVLPVHFFKLRPPNFPTIRVAQLAAIYHQESDLFSKVVRLKTKEEAYELFNVEVSEFWKNHYTFKAVSKPSGKHLTKSFIDLLIINTVIPMQYTYAKQMGKEMDEEVLMLAHTIAPEKNSIVEKFNNLKALSSSALKSQALLQLKNNYCDKQKCLECAIGNALLSRELK
ncbi:MAG: DUF2851 family protein [Mangrovimonas sp.]|nr:DUF2851 family protein [Mangrovimonas sp.]HPF98000.1 DUF2851 family protein [Mangrovimonas sp.]HRV54576.1 DUF2851 family protein [Mangrovimonas sp.]